MKILLHISGTKQGPQIRVSRAHPNVSSYHILTTLPGSTPLGLLLTPGLVDEYDEYVQQGDEPRI